MAPGAMQLARTPPPSSAIALVSATTPALEAAYAAEPRTPLNEAAFSAATFTMRPSPRIRRSAARQQRKQERRLMSTIFSNSSTEVCANGAPIQPPAQCRSEEHTSELQSQSNLVCRLLLEKKKPPCNRTHRTV